jgi:hypothetical protein
VPKEKEDLYAMAVDWSVLESSSTIENKMKPWIAKKVTEYFGETDETVIAFVMEEVRTNVGEKHPCLFWRGSQPTLTTRPIRPSCCCCCCCC